MKSAAFQWSKDDTHRVLKAAGFAIVSAVIAGLVAVFSSEDLPSWVLPMVPLVNTFLYGVSRWVMDNRP